MNNEHRRLTDEELDDVVGWAVAGFLVVLYVVGLVAWWLS